jgi:hypothetical protein
MTRAEIKQRKTTIRSEAIRVRQILNEWDPLPGSPSDEYDCLVDKIVSVLHRGVTAHGLAEVVCSEFESHFGVAVARNEAVDVAMRIMSWWTTSQVPGPRA